MNKLWANFYGAYCRLLCLARSIWLPEREWARMRLYLQAPALLTGGVGMASPTGYDAFISYSHQHDGHIAPALENALERFAKPWYRLRALRVFRDTTNLGANPSLWGSIQQA